MLRRETDVVLKTKHSWARLFSQKIKIKDQFACARYCLALRDNEEPSREKCERECHSGRRTRFPTPSTKEILRAWEQHLAVSTLQYL